MSETVNILRLIAKVGSVWVIGALLALGSEKLLPSDRALAFHRGNIAYAIAMNRISLWVCIIGAAVASLVMVVTSALKALWIKYP